MSDTSADPGAGNGTDAGAAPGRQPVTPIQFLGQYIKDLSFEAPHTPDIFQELRETAPDIPIAIDVSVRELKESQYEVTLSVHVEATSGEKSVFILEVDYACVVKIGDIGDEHVRPILMIEVPRQMYPFVRQIIADLTVQGGFPPLMLQLVDFIDLYRQKYETDEDRAREAARRNALTGGAVAGQNL